MTKTLTEQFREESLKDGFYYVHIPNAICDISILDEYELRSFIGVRDWYKIEVVGAVPSYDEFVQQRDFVKDHLKVLIENMNLKRKLEIATKALKEYMTFCRHPAEEALKEMKGVK